MNKHLEHHFDLVKLSFGHRTLGSLEKGKEEFRGEGDLGNLIEGKIKGTKYG